MSDGKEVKTWDVRGVMVEPRDFMGEYVLAADHDRIVAELKAEYEKLQAVVTAPQMQYEEEIAELRAELIEPISGNTYKELYDYANAFAAELQEKNNDLEKQVELLKVAHEKWLKFDAFLKDDGDVSASVYESAVKGRSDFRQALKEARHEIATQSRVIEKLKEQRDVAHERARNSADEMLQRINEDDQELVAIEKPAGVTLPPPGITSKRANGRGEG